MNASNLNLVMPLLLFAVFYFFIIRPQNTRQGDQKTFLESIAKGDTVGTASGIIGKINAIDGAIVTLEIDKNTYIKVTKSSISKEVTDSLKAVAA